MRLDVRVGVHGNEQISTHPPSLVHAIHQRHEIVTVAREDSAHVWFSINLRLEFARDGQRYLFFVSPMPPSCPRISPAMPGIDGDGHKAHDFGLRLGLALRRLLCRIRFCRALRSSLMLRRRWGGFDARSVSTRRLFGVLCTE